MRSAFQSREAYYPGCLGFVSGIFLTVWVVPLPEEVLEKMVVDYRTLQQNKAKRDRVKKKPGRAARRRPSSLSPAAAL